MIQREVVKTSQMDQFEACLNQGGGTVQQDSHVFVLRASLPGRSQLQPFSHFSPRTSFCTASILNLDLDVPVQKHVDNRRHTSAHTAGRIDSSPLCAGQTFSVPGKE